jgi:hypothetical protein
MSETSGTLKIMSRALVWTALDSKRSLDAVVACDTFGSTSYCGANIHMFSMGAVVGRFPDNGDAGSTLQKSPFLPI